MDTKQKLRREFKACGAALTREYRDFADCAIRSFVLQSAVWQSARRVFLYVSMWAEPDTRALIDTALREGRRVYVPLCCPDHVMKAVRIRSLSELRPGTLGIPEPPAGNGTAAPGDLDLAVVPCVTASKAGARLGHGAGYYDRFLTAFNCETVCLCYEQMLTETIPAEEHDVRMDCVLSERACYRRPPE